MSYRPMPKYNTELVELGDSLYAYLQWDGGWGISNAGFLDGGDGLLVIDALMVPSMTRAFIEAMRGVSNAPFRHLVNTHMHSDHTNGNQVHYRRRDRRPRAVPRGDGGRCGSSPARRAWPSTRMDWR